MFTYEINIAIHSKAFDCAVHWGRIKLNAQASEAGARFDFETACLKFPASEGWSLTLHRVPTATSETIAYSEGA